MGRVRRCLGWLVSAAVVAGCGQGDIELPPWTAACLDVACSGHGQCATLSGEPICLCEEGYHAEDLSCVADPVDPCEGVDCAGHGGCQTVDGQPSCLCDAGYHADGLSCLPDQGPGDPLVPRQKNGLPVVLLKLDDMGNFMGDEAAKAAWFGFVDYIQTKGIKANIGLLGRAFGETGSTVQQTYDQLLQWMEGGRIEVWNHGMCYCPEEFSPDTSDYDSQYAQIEEAQARFEQSLGVRPIGFGSGGNLKTADTTDVVMDHPDLRVWLFGAPLAANRKVLSLNVRLGIANVDADKLLSTADFLAGVSKNLDQPYFVLQGHAGKWAASHLKLFKATMDALIARYPAIAFMTISEYVVHCGGVLR